MWDASTGSLKNARSPAELADKMIGMLKRNVQENPDLSALLFEVWVSGRRSSKIWKVFNEGFSETIDRLKRLLEFTSSIGITRIKPDESEGVVRILLAKYHGLAIQLISDPGKIEDKKIWLRIRRMLLSAFEGNGGA